MRKLWGIAMVALALGTTTPTHAYFVDGNDLLALCGGDLITDKTQCLGYVTGTYDTVMFHSANDVCVPGEVTSLVMRDAVLARLKATPEMLAAPAAMLIFLALRDAWPC